MYVRNQLCFHCSASESEKSDGGFFKVKTQCDLFCPVRCVEYLLRNNADPSVRDKQGYSAVHYASAYGRTLCLELVSKHEVMT